MTSSGDGSLVVVGGFKIFGGGISGSLRCASPSTRTVPILLYLPAFLRMEAMFDKYYRIGLNQS